MTRPACVILISVLLALSGVHASQKAALLFLAKAVDPDKRLGWDLKAKICSYDGVSCTGSDVSRIDISNKTLSGYLPGSIWGAFPELSYFTARDNYLSRGVPDFKGAKSLATVDLSTNRLTGTVPAALAKLPSLAYVNLLGNPDLCGFKKLAGLQVDTDSSALSACLEQPPTKSPPIPKPSSPPPEESPPPHKTKSPAPLPASPEPLPSSPAPPAEPTTPADPEQGTTLTMVLQGITDQQFKDTYQRPFTALLAVVAGVAPSDVTIESVEPASAARRLRSLLQPQPAVKVSSLIRGDPTTILPKLQTALTSSDFTDRLTQAKIPAQPVRDSIQLIAQTRTSPTPSPTPSTPTPPPSSNPDPTAPAPGAATSPAPAPKKKSDDTTTKSIIIGAVIGGVLLLVLTAALAVYCFYRPRKAGPPPALPLTSKTTTAAATNPNSLTSPPSNGVAPATTRSASTKLATTAVAAGAASDTSTPKDTIATTAAVPRQDSWQYGASPLTRDAPEPAPEPAPDSMTAMPGRFASMPANNAVHAAAAAVVAAETAGAGSAAAGAVQRSNSSNSRQRRQADRRRFWQQFEMTWQASQLRGSKGSNVNNSNKTVELEEVEEPGSSGTSWTSEQEGRGGAGGDGGGLFRLPLSRGVSGKK